MARLGGGLAWTDRVVWAAAEWLSPPDTSQESVSSPIFAFPFQDPLLTLSLMLLRSLALFLKDTSILTEGSWRSQRL